MSKRTKITLIAIAIIAGCAATAHRLDRPRRLRSQFIGNLYHARYDEAAEMLQPPSAIEQGPDGNLQVTAETGNSTTVLANTLPFKSGGGRSLQHGEFSATALGPSTNGILHTPAVSLRLTLDGVKVRIVSIDI